jgi:peptide deformylase
MRSVKTATWTWLEPLSVSCVLYFSTTSFFFFVPIIAISFPPEFVCEYYHRLLSLKQVGCFGGWVCGIISGTFMSVLDVVVYPDPVLRQKTSPVSVFDAQLEALVRDMFETMDAYQGVGLAAPQIGILEKVIVVSFEGRSMALLNPQIVSSTGVTVDEEGCLSLPEIVVKLERADKIVVNAQDLTGKPLTLHEEGFFSRIIQHEIDHLNGILIVDKEPVE